MKPDCIFCSLISGAIPAKIIADYPDIFVIADNAPKAPFHVLIMPKKHITNLLSCAPEDIPLVTRMMTVVQEIAKKLPEPISCRLVMNNGAASGQSVFHMHMHMLSGKTMSDL